MCGLSRIVCPYKYIGELATIGSWRPSAAGDHRQLATIGKINPIPNNTFATSEHLILSHFAQAEYFLDI
jgi:hypothetical protein